MVPTSGYRPHLATLPHEQRKAKQKLISYLSPDMKKSNLKPLSVTTNVVGLQTDNARHVGQNSSAYVARVVGLQTDAVVVTETRFRIE